MKNLIKFELSKLTRSKSFIICTVIMVALLFLSVITMWWMGEELKDMAAELGESIVVEYDLITSVIQAASNADFALIVGIVIAIMVCSDFSQGTIKTVIAKGYSRTDVYFAKLISISVMSVFMYIVSLIFGFIFGIMFFGFSLPDGLGWLGILGVQFVSAIAVAFFAFFVSATARKLSTSILIIIILPTVLELVLLFIDVFAETSISNYWLTSVFTTLSDTAVETKTLLSSLAASFAYVAAFFIGGWVINRKYSY